MDVRHTREIVPGVVVDTGSNGTMAEFLIRDPEGEKPGEEETGVCPATGGPENPSRRGATTPADGRLKPGDGLRLTPGPGGRKMRCGKRVPGKIGTDRSPWVTSISID